MKRLLSGFKGIYFMILYFADIVTFWVSHLLAYSIFFFKDGFSYLLSDTRLFVFALLVLLVNFSTLKLYRNKRNLFDDTEFMAISESLFVTFFLVILSALLFNVTSITYYLLFTVSLGIFLILDSVVRFVLSRIIYYFRKQGYDQKKVYFFGDDNKDIYDKVQENTYLGYNVLGRTNSLKELKKQLSNVDLVFVTKETIDDALLEVIIENFQVQFKIIPSSLNLVIDPVDFDEFKDYPVINVSRSKISTRSRVYKRAFDFMVSGLSLLILSPLMLLTALLIKVTSKGPVFFKQERLGRDLKPFYVYKFRSMVVDAEEQKKKLMKSNEVKGLFKMKHDPRITPLGRFLRRSCIDELPQLINIFKGDMSIVGPRPHLQSELEHFKGWRMQRFKLKPGLTGMWQVAGRHELNFDKAVMYDIYYIKHMSLLLDLKIIFKTIPAIILNRGKF